MLESGAFALEPKILTLFFLEQLDMPIDHLVSNFNSLLTNVNTMRPKREGRFITRVIFTSAPSKEKFKIDPKEFPFDYEQVSATDKSKPATPAFEEPEEVEAENEEAAKAKN